MTEKQIQGKWFRVLNNTEFKITEFKLAGPATLYGPD